MKIISDARLQNLIGWQPHPAQQTILEGAKGKKEVSVCAGVRFGKSMLLGYKAFKHLMSNNQRIWIVSLSYDMAGKCFNHLVDFASRWDKRMVRNVSHRPPQRFEVPEWNSWAECRSIENVNSLLGEELDLVVMDEASRFPPDIYERYLMARLLSRKGQSFGISTPFGKNWFYQYHQRCLENQAGFHFTSYDNPHTPKEWLEKAKNIMPERVYNQEIMAMFTEGAASVFRGISEIVGDTLKDVQKGSFYIMGVDIGKVVDFTVLTTIDRRTNEVVYWDRFQKIDYPLQKARIEATAKRYNNARIIVDSTNVGEPIKEDLERMGLLVDDFKFTNKSKRDLIDKLSIFIEQKFIKIPKEPILLNELEMFGVTLSDSGNIIYGAPKGFQDDCVTSLGLAVWGLPPGKPLSTDPLAREMAKSRKIKIKSFV